MSGFMRCGLWCVAAALLLCGCGSKANTPPVADDQSVNTSEQVPTSITLTATDGNGDALTFVIDSMPSDGVLDTTNLPDVVYTSNASFAGVDSFTFHANDGTLDGNVATVYIGVDNSAPSTSGLSDATDEDVPLPLTLSASDPDGDALRWVWNTPPVHGALSGSGPAFTYTPDLNFNGSDSFQFHVTDGVASSATYAVDITINSINDAPVCQDLTVQTEKDTAVDITLAGTDAESDPITFGIASGPSHGTLTGSGANRQYTPGPGYVGSDSFTYDGFDGQDTGAAASVTITVTEHTARVWAWGRNSNGQVGDGTTTNRSIPVVVPGLWHAVAIDGGHTHSLAVKDDGTVWAWGANASGQLGDGTTNPSLTPKQVPGLADVVDVAGGGSHSLALKTDGTVWAWGLNTSGQIGDGTTTGTRLAPQQVIGLAGVSAIAAGEAHSMALKSDGTVWCWGSNSDGQLGNGGMPSNGTPVQVLVLTGVSHIAAGYRHSLALKPGGFVWDWGDNSAGQLGDGTSNDEAMPIQAAYVTSAVDVMGGAYTSLAFLFDTSIFVWGQQFALAPPPGQPKPPLMVPFEKVASGGYHGLIIREDWVAMAWGNNTYGQVGDGTTQDRVSPVYCQIGLLQEVAGGGHHSLAIEK